MKKKSFVTGALILILSAILVKLIGAIYRIPLTYILSAEGIGVYQLVYPVFALFLVLSSSGVPVSISKLISKENSKGNFTNSKIIFKYSLKIMLILGLIFSLIIVVFSGVISSIQGNSELQLCYLILAPCIILGSSISAIRGYFQGFEIMKYSAISQIIEQLVKLIFGLFLAYILLPYGLIYGVCGAFLGILVSEIISVLYLFLVYKKNINKINFNENFDTVLTKSEAVKLIISQSLPITLSSIIIPLTSVVDSLIIVKLLGRVGFNFQLSTSLYGLDSGVVASLINLPSVIAISVGVSLMPSITSSFAQNNFKEVNLKSKLALKLIWYFTLPCLLVFLLYSKEICYFLYGSLNSEIYNQLMVASTMLKLSSFSIIYIAFNHILTTILQALNKSYFAFYTLLFASVIKVILTIVLVLNNSINIYGLVISDVICYSIASVINLFKTKQYVNLNFKFKEIFLVPLLALSTMAISLVLFKVLLLSSLNRGLILLSLGVSFILYLVVVILFKGFNIQELSKTKILKFIKRKKY